MGVVLVDGAGGAPGIGGAEVASIEALLAGQLPPGATAIVLRAPAPGWEREEPLARAVEASGLPAIVVRDERWDGFTPDPLAAACRGAISGFGDGGLRQALAVLGQTTS